MNCQITWQSMDLSTVDISAVPVGHGVPHTYMFEMWGQHANDPEDLNPDFQFPDTKTPSPQTCDSLLCNATILTSPSAPTPPHIPRTASNHPN
jgi:hypothetical protein